VVLGVVGLRVVDILRRHERNAGFLREPAPIWRGRRTVARSYVGKQRYHVMAIQELTGCGESCLTFVSSLLRLSNLPGWRF
jgi:hypothetical protein